MIESIKFVIWMSYNLLGLYIAEVVTRKYYCPRLANNPYLSSWIIFHTDPDTGEKYFKISVNPISTVQRVRYFITTLHMIAIMYYYGNITEKITGSVWNLCYLLGYTVIPLFGLLGETKVLHGFVLTWKYLHHMSRPERLYFIFLVIISVILIGYHIYLSWIQAEFVQYIAGISGIPLLYYYLYQCTLTNKDHHWHIHHWFVGFYCALMYRYPTILSQIAWTVFYMIFLEGAYVEGPIPIIY